MADEPTAGFDLATAQRVVSATVFTEHNPRYPKKQPRQKQFPPYVWYWAKTTSAITAPSNGMSGATTFTFDLWVPNGSGGSPLTYVQTPDTTFRGLTGVNRFTGLANTSTSVVCQVEYANGEWNLKGIDC